MCNKLLTISVAAYNVQNYIEQCLDSLCIEEIFDDIEVLVIDDGSSDDTYSIVKKYEDKYPDVFKLVNKENGGYGSTVNYSIEHATGKYFKLLDGDDWFDNDGLKSLVNFLKETDIDCVLTKFKKHIFKNMTIKVVDGIKFQDLDKKILINDLDFNEGIPMHCITYKLDVLKDLHLKEHMLYTDNYYATLPFKNVKDVIFKDISVYNYRLGLDNQSVNKEKMINNLKDLREISIDLVKSYNSENKYLLNRIASTCVDYFVVLSKMKNQKEELIKFDKEIKNISIDAYKKMAMLNRNASRVLNIIRKFNYIFV